MSDVAVIVVTYNMAGTLKGCIKSLLDQTAPNFRLIIINDASTDNTEDTVNSFSDKRIYYKRNDKHLGIAASRNRGLAELKNEKIVFFTDADCCVESDWIKEGVKAFDSDLSIVAVEGITTYEREGYHPQLSEKSYHSDFIPGMCHTDNCAYSSSVFQKIGRFDETNFNYLLEDTDFFYRARKAFPEKKFLVCPNMKAIHRKATWGIYGFLIDTHKVKYFIKIIKIHGRLDYGAGRLGSFVLSPKNFILAIFPPAILIYLWRYNRRISNLYDVLFVLLYIAKAYYYRLLVCYYGLKEKIFII